MEAAHAILVDPMVEIARSSVLAPTRPGSALCDKADNSRGFHASSPGGRLPITFLDFGKTFREFPPPGVVTLRNRCRTTRSPSGPGGPSGRMKD